LLCPPRALHAALFYRPNELILRDVDLARRSDDAENHVGNGSHNLGLLMGPNDYCILGIRRKNRLASVHDRACGEVILFIPVYCEVPSKADVLLLVIKGAVLSEKMIVLGVPALNALIYSPIVRVYKQCATGVHEVQLVLQRVGSSTAGAPVGSAHANRCCHSVSMNSAATGMNTGAGV
jgi:hypothetical protein